MPFPVAAIPIIGDLFKAGIDIINKLVPDKDLAARLQQELILKEYEAQKQLLEMAAAEGQAQAEINKVEAASESFFVAGWRPAIGWTCAAGFMYQFLMLPGIQWYIEIKGLKVTSPPTLSDVLMELTMGMLGLGALRTYEKLKGKQNAKAQA